MPLHHKSIRHELLLPNVILCNQMFMATSKMDGYIKPAENKTSLPNLQITHVSVDRNLNEDEELKSRRKPESCKQRHEDLKRSRSLEFVNIVDNPPTEWKFLSRTEVREPSQLSQDVCTRWLEHLARSIQEQIKDPGSRPSRSRDVDRMIHTNSEDYISDQDQWLQELESISSIVMNKSTDELSMQPNSGWSRTNKEQFLSPILPKKAASGISLSLRAAKSGMDNADEGVAKAIHGLKEDDEDLFTFVARRIDLVERKETIRKKEPSSAITRKDDNEYNISVDLLKGKYFNFDDTTKRAGVVKNKICYRFEKRFKSAPKDRVRATNDDLLKANKIRLYPFYEAKWSRDEMRGNGDGIIESNTNSKEIDKTEVTHLVKYQHKKGILSDEISNEVKENLKVSPVQLAVKNVPLERSGIQKKTETEDKKFKETEFKVLKISCPQNVKSNQSHEYASNILHCDFDLSSLLTMSSSSLRETMLLLARITANSQLLTDQQILRLIENGEINISKFLIIKKLLIALHPYQSGTATWNNSMRPRKEIMSLLNEVLAFIDRCENLLKQSKVIYSYDDQNVDVDFGVDCVQRGKVIGKMPSISVTGYNRSDKCKNGIVEHGNNLQRKSKLNIIKCRKLRLRKENEEEFLERKAISISSLRRSILVNAMDLATHSGWKRSYILKRRYLPKKKKIKSLCLDGFQHVNTITTRNLPEKVSRDTFPLVDTPSSGISISTSFESSELQDYHIPKEQSALDQIRGSRDWLRVSLEQPDGNNNCNDIECKDSEELKEMKKESLGLRRKISRGNKVCEFLKGRVSLKLQKNFDLYPKIQRLMSSLHDKTESRDDIKAMQESKTDFISHFKLIDPNRYEMYCKAFAKVDRQNIGVISSDMVKMAVRFVDSVASCPVLDALMMPKITIKMFCVICGVLERMIQGGVVISDAVDALNLMMSEGKMIWYKKMFYDSSEIDKNFISLETVKVELFAGGMGKAEEEQISEKIVDKDSNKVSVWNDKQVTKGSIF